MNSKRNFTIYLPVILCTLLSFPTLATTPPLFDPDITITDSVTPANDLYIPFGSVTVSSSSYQTVTVTNDGTNADLDIDNIALSPPFTKETDTCSPQPLAPSASCRLTIRFSPDSPDSFCETFDILSNNPDESTVTVAVSGTGFSASASNNPPTTPLLVYPTDNQTGLGTTVEFRWKKSTDPDGDTVTYDLYYCEDPNFTGCSTPINVASLKNKSIYYAGIGGMWFLLLGMIVAITGSIRKRKKISLLITAVIVTGTLLVSCGDNSSTSNNELSYAISGLSTGTTYYWKVIAKDSDGKETGSCVVWSFTP